MRGLPWFVRAVDINDVCQQPEVRFYSGGGFAPNFSQVHFATVFTPVKARYYLNPLHRYDSPTELHLQSLYTLALSRLLNTETPRYKQISSAKS